MEDLGTAQVAARRGGARGKRPPAPLAEGHDAGAVISEALNELTFFMLFQCGELLDPQSDEHLGRRVRLIHASLR